MASPSDPAATSAIPALLRDPDHRNVERASAAEAVALAEARRAHIAARLPWFALGWIGVGSVLRAGLVLRGGISVPLAVVTIALQALVLAAAIVWCHAAPRAPRVPRIAFGACVVLVLLATAFFVLLGGSVEVLVAAVLLICMGSSWAFAWGWRPALALLAISAAVTWPVVLEASSLRRFADPTEILLETVLGAGIALIVAEALAQSFAASFARAEQARAAADRLVASHAAYRDLAENAPDLIYAHDLAGRITYVNETFARSYGVSAHNLIGRAADDLIPRDPVNPDPATFRERLFAGEDVSPRIYRVPSPTGPRWLECVSSAITDADGRVIGARGMARDVTDRREAEEALRTSLEELRRSEEQLRHLARHQASIREDERKRLGFDLHDDVCQELVGIGILVESLRRKLDEQAPALVLDLARIGRYVGEVGEHLRQMARDLRPMLLRDLGLEESLCSLAEGMTSAGTIVTTQVRTAIPRLDEETEIGVYRIAQEALANASRHAGARAIRLTLAVTGRGLELEIADDGRGFAPATRRGSDALGLVGMEERALALGGRLELRSAPGEGTLVRLTCPATLRASVSAA
jgi:PAS domain S-box-containing protein